MVGLPSMSDRGLTLVRSLRSVLHALDEHYSAAEREQIYASLAAHLRSASPMAFGVPVDPEPLRRATIVCAAGTLDLTNDDGTLVLYAVEASSKDAAVGMTAEQVEQLRAALGRVLASGGVR